MPPLTGDRQFRNQTVRIADLTVTTTSIEGYEFSGCRLIGPAVLAFVDDNTLTGCTFDAPGLEALFWEVPPNRGPVVGAVAVAVANCMFSGCRFEMIGIAGPPEARAMLQQGFSGG